MKIADRDLVPLGVAGAPEGLGEATRAGLADPARAAAFLRRHRVVGLGLRNLELAAAAEPLPAPLAELRAWRRRLDDALKQAEEELRTAVAATGVGVDGIKGLSMRPLYGNPADRDIGDLDLMAGDVDSAWELASHLRSHGYEWCEYEWPWLKRDPRSGHLYGQFQVWRYLGGIYARFDIHFGGYSIRHCRLAAWPTVAPDYRPADPAANLACLLGNAAGDFLIRLKDVNDIVVLLQRGLLDRRLTEPLVSGLGLRRFWQALLARTAALAPLTSAETEALIGLRCARTRAQRVPFGVPSRTARTIATTFDAARAGRSAQGAAAGVTYGLGAFRYYAPKLTVRVAPCRHHHPGSVLADMSDRTCVRLIPPRMLTPGHAAPMATARRAIPGSGTFEEVTAAGHTFAEAGGERFVPTVFYRLCAVEAHRAPPH